MLARFGHVKIVNVQNLATTLADYNFPQKVLSEVFAALCLSRVEIRWRRDRRKRRVQSFMWCYVDCMLD
jgi:hypothetical protein